MTCISAYTLEPLLHSYGGSPGRTAGGGGGRSAPAAVRRERAAAATTVDYRNKLRQEVAALRQQQQLQQQQQQQQRPMYAAARAPPRGLGCGPTEPRTVHNPHQHTNPNTSPGRSRFAPPAEDVPYQAAGHHSHPLAIELPPLDRSASPASDPRHSYGSVGPEGTPLHAHGYTHAHTLQQEQEHCAGTRHRREGSGPAGRQGRAPGVPARRALSPVSHRHALPRGPGGAPFLPFASVDSSAAVAGLAGSLGSRSFADALSGSANGGVSSGGGARLSPLTAPGGGGGGGSGGSNPKLVASNFGYVAVHSPPRAVRRHSAGEGAAGGAARVSVVPAARPGSHGAGGELRQGRSLSGSRVEGGSNGGGVYHDHDAGPTSPHSPAMYRGPPQAATVAAGALGQWAPSPGGGADGTPPPPWETHDAAAAATSPDVSPSRRRGGGSARHASHAADEPQPRPQTRGRAGGSWQDLGSQRAAEQYAASLPLGLVNVSFSTAGLSRVPPLQRLMSLESLGLSFNHLVGLAPEQLTGLSDNLQVKGPGGGMQGP